MTVGFWILAMLLAVLTPVYAQTPSAEELYRDAAAANQRGDFARAIALYEQLLKLQPDSAELRTNFGVVLAHAGRYAEAVAQYQEALNRAPNNPIIQLNLALAWYKQADFSKAASELEKVRKLQYENRQALYLLADCYLRLEKNKEAVALLEPVYEANPADRAVTYALGMALISDGQVQKGSAVIDRFLRDGNSPEADLLVGAAQLAAGEYQKASASLRKAMERNPQLP
jgi:Flp pilus assembly protein TadD